MLAAVSLLIGILLGVAILSFARRGGAAGWLTLAFGLVALAALVLGTRMTSGPGNAGLPWLNLSIALALAAVVAGIGMLRRGERGWPTWGGLIAGLIPAVFWVWFTFGSLLGSG